MVALSVEFVVRIRSYNKSSYRTLVVHFSTAHYIRQYMGGGKTHCETLPFDVQGSARLRWWRSVGPEYNGGLLGRAKN